MKSITWVKSFPRGPSHLVKKRRLPSIWMHSTKSSNWNGLNHTLMLLSETWALEKRHIFLYKPSRQICCRKQWRHCHRSLILLACRVISGSHNMFYILFNLSCLGMKCQSDGRSSVGKGRFYIYGYPMKTALWRSIHQINSWHYLSTKWQRWEVACLKKHTFLGDWFTNESYGFSLSMMKTRIIRCACHMQASES